MRSIRLQADEPDQSEDQRNEDSEVEEPESEKWHSEFGAWILLRPTGKEFEDGAGMEMIADEPDKKGRWNKSAQDKSENVAANLRIPRHKKADERDGERDEGVKMKKRHRRIKRELNPKRKRPRLSASADPSFGGSILPGVKIFFAPMPE